MHLDFQSQFYPDNALHTLLPYSDNLCAITHSRVLLEIPFPKNLQPPAETAPLVRLQFCWYFVSSQLNDQSQILSAVLDPIGNHTLPYCLLNNEDISLLPAAAID